VIPTVNPKYIVPVDDEDVSDSCTANNSLLKGDYAIDPKTDVTMVVIEASSILALSHFHWQSRMPRLGTNANVTGCAA
jgi:hypothetical protein